MRSIFNKHPSAKISSLKYLITSLITNPINDFINNPFTGPFNNPKELFNK
jgi:hypothetical protein